jgi:hypothetical protein
MKENHLGA